MNSKIILALLIFTVSLSSFTQESPRMAVSVGAEGNMNSRENFAAGAVLNLDVNFASSFAIGFNITGSSSFSDFFVIEHISFIRWYFLGNNYTGWFAQADIGTYIFFEDERATPLILGGLRGGMRLPLGTKFFIEPYGRFGHPFVFGIGILTGVLF